MYYRVTDRFIHLIKLLLLLYSMISMLSHVYLLIVSTIVHIIIIIQRCSNFLIPQILCVFKIIYSFQIIDIKLNKNKVHVLHIIHLLINYKQKNCYGCIMIVAF